MATPGCVMGARAYLLHMQLIGVWEAQWLHVALVPRFPLHLRYKMLISICLYALNSMLFRRQLPTELEGPR